MYKLHIPAPIEHSSQAAKIAEHYFKSDRLSDEYEHAVFQKNPYQLVTITNQKDRVIAYTDSFILNPAAYRQLAESELLEDQLTVEHFLTYPEALKTKFIYFAGIAIQDLNDPDRPILRNALLHGWLKLMRYYVTGERTVDCMMIAYSQHGQNMANFLGFQYAKDHSYGPLYKQEISLSTIEKIYNSLPLLDPRIKIIE